MSRHPYAKRPDDYPGAVGKRIHAQKAGGAGKASTGAPKVSQYSIAKPAAALTGNFPGGRVVVIDGVPSFSTITTRPVRSGVDVMPTHTQVATVVTPRDRLVSAITAYVNQGHQVSLVSTLGDVLTPEILESLISLYLAQNPAFTMPGYTSNVRLQPASTPTADPGVPAMPSANEPDELAGLPDAVRAKIESVSPAQRRFLLQERNLRVLMRRLGDAAPMEEVERTFDLDEDDVDEHERYAS